MEVYACNKSPLYIPKPLVLCNGTGLISVKLVAGIVKVKCISNPAFCIRSVKRCLLILMPKKIKIEMSYRKMNGIKPQYFTMLSFVVLFTLYLNNQQIVEGNTMNNSEQFNIKITIGDTLLTATLYDNPTTRDFISLLP